MAYFDNLATAEHSIFRGRVRMAAVAAAVTVYAEAPSGNSTKTTGRKNLATNVLNDPAKYEERFVWAVLTNPTIAAAGINATDTDLAWVITQVWDALAGV